MESINYKSIMFLKHRPQKLIPKIKKREVFGINFIKLFSFSLGSSFLVLVMPID
jgi:hypothetical protein